MDAILGGIDVLDSMFQTLAEEEYPGPVPVDLVRTIKMLSRSESDCGDSLAAITGVMTDAQAAPVIGDPAVASVEAAICRLLNRRRHPPKRTSARRMPSLPLLPPLLDRLAGVLKRLRARCAWRPGRLDAVMNQVGELVLLRNRLTSAVGGLEKEDENMSRIAREMDLRVSDSSAQ